MSVKRTITCYGRHVIVNNVSLLIHHNHIYIFKNKRRNETLLKKIVNKSARQNIFGVLNKCNSFEFGCEINILALVFFFSFSCV